VLSASLGDLPAIDLSGQLDVCSAMPSRKQHSLKDQLAEEKKRPEEQAALLPDGPLKDQLLRKIRFRCRVATQATSASPR
jgi:hypothetical protein